MQSIDELIADLAKKEEALIEEKINKKRKFNEDVSTDGKKSKSKKEDEQNLPPGPELPSNDGTEGGNPVVFKDVSDGSCDELKEVRNKLKTQTQNNLFLVQQVRKVESENKILKKADSVAQAEFQKLKEDYEKKV